jgi:NTP pyrophosphatase (non-canonical NTP hydrolase)
MAKMPHYTDLQKAILKFRDDRDWKKFHLPKNMVIGLWVEVGELAEHFQYRSDEGVITQLKERRKDVAGELVDVLFWTLLIGHDFNLDLGIEFSRKMKKNLKKDEQKKYLEVTLDIPDSIESLSEMQKIIHGFREARGWNKKSHPRDLLLKMFEEVGELAEHVQWKSGDELDKHIAENKVAIADEVVDILICILLLFKHLDYDIQLEFERKMEKNAKKYPID